MKSSLKILSKSFIAFAIFACVNLCANAEDSSANSLKSITAQTFEIDKNLAQEQTAWQTEKSLLLSKIESLKTLNSRLESDILEAQKKAQKSKEFYGEISLRLKQHSDFEKSLKDFAPTSSKKFTTEIPKNIEPKLLNFSEKSPSDFQSIYAYWSHLINYRISLLEKSQTLGVVYQNDGTQKKERFLRIGLFAILNGSKNKGVAEVCDMLENKKTMQLQEIEIGKADVK